MLNAILVKSDEDERRIKGRNIMNALKNVKLPSYSINQQKKQVKPPTVASKDNGDSLEDGHE